MQVSARTERSSLVYFENRTPFRLTLLPSASLCSEGDWSDPNIWDEAQGLSHYTPGELCVRVFLRVCTIDCWTLIELVCNSGPTSECTAVHYGSVCVSVGRREDGCSRQTHVSCPRKRNCCRTAWLANRARACHGVVGNAVFRNSNVYLGDCCSAKPWAHWQQSRRQEHHWKQGSTTRCSPNSDK